MQETGDRYAARDSNFHREVRAAKLIFFEAAFERGFSIYHPSESFAAMR
jgi:hypothetical protein